MLDKTFWADPVGYMILKGTPPFYRKFVAFRCKALNRLDLTAIMVNKFCFDCIEACIIFGYFLSDEFVKFAIRVHRRTPNYRVYCRNFGGVLG